MFNLISGQKIAVSKNGCSLPMNTEKFNQLMFSQQ